MVVGVDVSRNSTENRCFQGNCRGVVARKSRTETHRSYPGVFIVESARCFHRCFTGHSPCGLWHRAVSSRHDGAVQAGPGPRAGEEAAVLELCDPVSRGTALPVTAWG